MQCLLTFYFWHTLTHNVYPRCIQNILMLRKYDLFGAVFAHNFVMSGKSMEITFWNEHWTSGRNTQPNSIIVHILVWNHHSFMVFAWTTNHLTFKLIGENYFAYTLIHERNNCVGFNLWHTRLDLSSFRCFWFLSDSSCDGFIWLLRHFCHLCIAKHLL